VNILQLEALIPTSVITALSGAPEGLDAAGEVYVSDRKRPSIGASEIWVRKTTDAPEILQEVQGNTLLGYSYTFLLISDVAKSIAQRWAQLMRDYFHLSNVPSGVDGLMVAQVTDMVFDEYPGEGEDAAASVTIQFIGVESPASVAAGGIGGFGAGEGPGGGT